MISLPEIIIANVGRQYAVANFTAEYYPILRCGIKIAAANDRRFAGYQRRICVSLALRYSTQFLAGNLTFALPK